MNRNESKKMKREEFESAVASMLETYHLPVDNLAVKKKHFPLNNYVLSTPQELVDRYEWN